MRFFKKMLTWNGLGMVLLGVSMHLSSVTLSFAHCDTMNGPVIPEARAALEKGDVTPVLKWIKPEYETEIKTVFDQTMQVRTMGPMAKELADKYFFETLIRLHRAGEGAPYTGLKDEPVEPIVAMADKALVEGSIDGLLQAITSHMSEAISEKFKIALEASKSKDKSVTAGREYVEAYIQYMHFIEGIHTAIMQNSAHHSE
jgi:hypothetical protein